MTSTTVHLALNFIDWACGHPYDELATQDPADVTCPDCLDLSDEAAMRLIREFAAWVGQDTGVTCRLCPISATVTTRYVVMRDGEEYTSVTHAACERHAAGLSDAMIEAGWIVA